MSLTYAEIAALPDGTKLRITWSGGNGPHVYTLHRHGPDDLYAAMGSGHDDPMWHYNPLDDFIGDGPPYTVVELPEK